MSSNMMSAAMSNLALSQVSNLAGNNTGDHLETRDAVDIEALAKNGTSSSSCTSHMANKKDLLASWHQRRHVSASETDGINHDKICLPLTGNPTSDLSMVLLKRLLMQAPSFRVEFDEFITEKALQFELHQSRFDLEDFEKVQVESIDDSATRNSLKPEPSVRGKVTDTGASEASEGSKAGTEKASVNEGKDSTAEPKPATNVGSALPAAVPITSTTTKSMDDPSLIDAWNKRFTSSRYAQVSSGKEASPGDH